jgi:hypothetical protein
MEIAYLGAKAEVQGSQLREFSQRVKIAHLVTIGTNTVGNGSLRGAYSIIE